MIPLKTKREIEIIKEGGKKLALVFFRVLEEIRPGIKLVDLDKLAETLIKKQGGFPSFKTVKGYKWATCININQGVVHGIPGNYQIKNGDLVSLDMGMLWKGFHTDMAWTIAVGEESQKANSLFLKAGKKALAKAIKIAKAGNRVGHISATIEKEIRRAGFQPVEMLTGHGVGKDLHEEPLIPCFLSEKIEKTPLLQEGMVLAIEVIYTQGKPDLVLADDGWTLETADGKLAALFEETILVTKKRSIVLTSLEKKSRVC